MRGYHFQFLLDERSRCWARVLNIGLSRLKIRLSEMESLPLLFRDGHIIGSFTDSKGRTNPATVYFFSIKTGA